MRMSTIFEHMNTQKGAHNIYVNNVLEELDGNAPVFTRQPKVTGNIINVPPL